MYLADVDSKTVPVKEARARFSELIEEVAFGGGRVVVTFHNRPRAALVSLEDLAKLEAIEAEAKPTKKRRPK